jgi:sec-independent protein translocase protein TatC
MDDDLEKRNRRVMTIIEHLEELRKRLIHTLIALFVAVPFCFYFSPDILVLLKEICPELPKLHGLGLTSLFFAEMKISIICGVLILLPYISYQLWCFIAPALFKKEKLFLFLFSMMSSLFFLAGSAFALFIIFPLMVKFMSAMYTQQADMFALTLTIDSVFTVVLMLVLGFGVMFQLPVVIFTLIRMRVLSVKQVAKIRPIVVVIIFILSAILTPPDVVSQVLMAGPTWLLFELSLLFARIGLRKQETDYYNQ